MSFFNTKRIFNIKKSLVPKDINGSHYYCQLTSSIFSINIASYKIKDSLTRSQHLYKKLHTFILSFFSVCVARRELVDCTSFGNSVSASSVPKD